MVERIRADTRAASHRLGAFLNRCLRLRLRLRCRCRGGSHLRPNDGRARCATARRVRARTRNGGPGRRAPCPARSCRALRPTGFPLRVFKTLQEAAGRRAECPSGSGPTASSARRTRSAAAITRSASSTPAPGAPRRPFPPPPATLQLCVMLGDICANQKSFRSRVSGVELRFGDQRISIAIATTEQPGDRTFGGVSRRLSGRRRWRSAASPRATARRLARRTGWVMSVLSERALFWRASYRKTGSHFFGSTLPSAEVAWMPLPGYGSTGRSIPSVRARGRGTASSRRSSITAQAWATVVRSRAKIWPTSVRFNRHDTCARYIAACRASAMGALPREGRPRIVRATPKLGNCGFDDDPNSPRLAVRQHAVPLTGHPVLRLTRARERQIEQHGDVAARAGQRDALKIPRHTHRTALDHAHVIGLRPGRISRDAVKLRFETTGAVNGGIPASRTARRDLVDRGRPFLGACQSPRRGAAGHWILPQRGFSIHAASAAQVRVVIRPAPSCRPLPRMSAGWHSCVSCLCGPPRSTMFPYQAASASVGLLERALLSERRRGRAGHWAYDLARHGALLATWRRERAALEEDSSERPRLHRTKKGGRPHGQAPSSDLNGDLNRGRVRSTFPGACGLLFPARAEARLLGEIRARAGVVRRNHRVVVREAPLLAVFFRREIVVRAQMALQRLELLAVFEADDVVGGITDFLDRNCSASAPRAPAAGPTPWRGSARRGFR